MCSSVLNNTLSQLLVWGFVASFGNNTWKDVVRLRSAASWFWLQEAMHLIIQLWFYELRCNVDLLLTSCSLRSYDKVNPSLHYARTCWFERNQAKLIMKAYWACWKVSLRHQLTYVLFFSIAGSQSAPDDWDKIPCTMELPVLLR